MGCCPVVEPGKDYDYPEVMQAVKNLPARDEAANIELERSRKAKQQRQLSRKQRRDENRRLAKEKLTQAENLPPGEAERFMKELDDMIEATPSEYGRWQKKLEYAVMETWKHEVADGNNRKSKPQTDYEYTWYISNLAEKRKKKKRKIRTKGGNYQQLIRPLVGEKKDEVGIEDQYDKLCPSLQDMVNSAKAAKAAKAAKQK